MLFHEHDCRWCGEKNYEVVIKGPDLLYDLPGTFQFVECKNCGLFRQNPYLDWNDLKKYYPNNFSSYHPQTSEIKSHIHRWDKRYGLWKRVKLVNKYQPKGNWVDIGAGTGRILHEASLWNKWELMGIEPVDYAAEYVRKMLGIEIFSGRLESFTGYTSYFDVVTMWDVLEHLEDPILSIRKVSEILKPCGIFVFSIPNLKSWDRKIFNKYWIGYDLPRHLHLFPEKLLKSVLYQNGLIILEKRCIAGSHGTLILNLKLWNTKTKSQILNRILRIGVDFFLFRLITFLPLWIFDKLGLGTSITYVVQKNETGQASI